MWVWTALTRVDTERLNAQSPAKLLPVCTGGPDRKKLLSRMPVGMDYLTEYRGEMAKNISNIRQEMSTPPGDRGAYPEDTEYQAVPPTVSLSSFNVG